MSKGVGASGWDDDIIESESHTKISIAIQGICDGLHLRIIIIRCNLLLV